MQLLAVNMVEVMFSFYLLGWLERPPMSSYGLIVNIVVEMSSLFGLTKGVLQGAHMGRAHRAFFRYMLHVRDVRPFSPEPASHCYYPIGVV